MRRLALLLMYWWKIHLDVTDDDFYEWSRDLKLSRHFRFLIAQFYGNWSEWRVLLNRQLRAAMKVKVLKFGCDWGWAQWCLIRQMNNIGPFAHDGTIIQHSYQFIQWVIAWWMFYIYILVLCSQEDIDSSWNSTNRPVRVEYNHFVYSSYSIMISDSCNWRWDNGISQKWTSIPMEWLDQYASTFQ